jgi:hypothetical protein
MRVRGGEIRTVLIHRDAPVYGTIVHEFHGDDRTTMTECPAGNVEGISVGLSARSWKVDVPTQEVSGIRLYADYIYDLD